MAVRYTFVFDSPDHQYDPFVPAQLASKFALQISHLTEIVECSAYSEEHERKVHAAAVAAAEVVDHEPTDVEVPSGLNPLDESDWQL